MTKRVLIIGGYGNFGSFITKTLAEDERIQIIIAGRSPDKAQNLAQEINAAHQPEYARIDINEDITDALAAIKPDIVVHTSGPFQKQSYDVAQACIAAGAHYIDLADGRDFVAGIAALDATAKAHNVLLISGASSVPCLTSALIAHYQPTFGALETIDYGITTAQKTARGLATTAAILGYTGKPFKTLIDGRLRDVYGWQNLHLRRYQGLGLRLLGNCDVPDLALFPKYYPTLKTIRFYAGLELPFIHSALWLLSWLVRIGLIKNLENAAPFLLKTSYLFDWFGTDKSGFHMVLSGTDQSGAPKSTTFNLIAKSGHGPYIPCMPAILLVKKLVHGDIKTTGAHPCIGFITKDEYLNALGHLDIQWNETTTMPHK